MEQIIGGSCSELYTGLYLYSNVILYVLYVDSGCHATEAMP